MNRIKDKLTELGILIQELESIMPSNFKEYSSDLKERAACERYFEKIVECITDISFLIIKQKKLGIPEEDKQSYDFLTTNNIITIDLSIKLKEAKGMRNILAHDYGKVDDELVFNSITSEIIADAREFIKQIKHLNDK
ncbi:DUF86 domain-containing protein [Candidatus Woesearchaeota archaeon]|nr:DUF86 domain-containing protein [Candidatus Woesearchaeota archaeon]MBL7050538.1 DUF86 domain-containing protein [Candidatus Woesearchaeota archaeon]